MLVALLMLNNSYCQTDCYFKFDTMKVLRNENLDFFINKLQTDSFNIGHDKHKIPLYIRKQLTCLLGDSLIANPNEDWQSSDVVFSEPDKVVWRQLVFFAQSNSVFFIVYLHGGIGVSTHLVLMNFRNKKMIDFWSGWGLRDITNVKKAVEYMKHNRKKLNTNIIEL